jgi:hypothetical protein
MLPNISQDSITAWTLLYAIYQTLVFADSHQGSLWNCTCPSVLFVQIATSFMGFWMHQRAIVPETCQLKEDFRKHHSTWLLMSSHRLPSGCRNSDRLPGKCSSNRWSRRLGISGAYRTPGLGPHYLRESWSDVLDMASVGQATEAAKPLNRD